MINFSQLAPPGSPEEHLARRLDVGNLPRHVAIIMDGNGRWAQERGLPRIEGHRCGVAAVRDTVEASAQLGLPVLTLFAFSVENWKRPKSEVWTLMNLLKEYLRRELQRLVEANIQLRVIGRWRELDSAVVKALERGLEATRSCTGMTLNVALNYSGRSEIVDACRRIVQDWAGGEKVDIDEETLGKFLYTSEQPDPDLVIRTSGEMRLSNFLLWQVAYSEIWVTQRYWPDFRRIDLLESILEYQSRQRRFGGLETKSQSVDSTRRRSS
ncbi:MAG: isoprenyl transferase [Deltaproteobacteria bacterium]|nr:isoprenyl transferase [Deltaproteobacteria bacterium]